MKTSQILKDALTYMQEHGRTTGQLVDDVGRVCAVGAVHCALTGNPHSMIAVPIEGFDREPYLAARRLLSQYAESVGYTAEYDGLDVELNDDPRNSDEDVYLMFKHAIAAAESAGL